MSIKVAVIGVGNCASSLVQAIVAAKQNKLDVGLSHEKMQGYGVDDIEIVAAFDIDKRKIKKDIAEAILSEPNCTTQYIEVPQQDVSVSVGCLFDGVGEHMIDMFKPAFEEIKNVDMEKVVQILTSSGAEIVVSYLPVGSQAASEFYAQAALKANCGFINCTPAKIATVKEWSDLYAAKKLPLLGDDIKSQIGSTAIHRALISLIEKKGITIDETYQLNIGGNTDFMNMRNPDRGAHKKHTKELSLLHLFSNQPELGVGPSDFVPQLRDNKVGYIHIQGRGILGMPFSLELRLKVEDSPNSAGVVLNAIRTAKIALVRGISGSIPKVSAAYFKNPPVLMSEEETFSAHESYLIAD